MKAQEVSLWNVQRLLDVRMNLQYNWIVKLCAHKADSLAKLPNISVVDKKNSISGNKHYYESLSIYFWPDTTSMMCGKYICKDGLINPDFKQYDGPRLLLLTQRLKFFSLAYFFTREKKYYNYFIKQVSAWFIGRKTKMLPDFSYAQIIPGANGNKGTPQGLIEAYAFNDVLESIRLVNSIYTIDYAIMLELKRWFSSFSKWMINSEIGIRERLQDNNHGVAFDVTLYNIAMFVGDVKIMSELTNSFAEKRLKKQIARDGRQINELKRTRAYFYSCYNIIHIIDFCLLQESCGNRFYNINNLQINSAIDYMLKYADNKRAFPYIEYGDWEGIVKELNHELLRLDRLYKDKECKKYNVGYVNAFETFEYLLK